MPTLTDLVIRITGESYMFEKELKKVRQKAIAANQDIAEAVKDWYRANQQVVKSMRDLERDWQVASVRITSNTIGLGRTLTTSITMPIVAAGTAAIKMANEFETSLAKISGLTGVARSQVQEWRKDIIDLSVDLGKSAQDLADGMYFISSSGFKGAEALEILKLSAKASAAGLGDTKVVADGLTSVMNAYSGTSLTAAKATDIFIATVREGKAEADKIAGSIGHLASIAAESGISFADVGAAIAGLTRVGLDAGESVTALKRMLTTLDHPSEQATEALTKVKLTAADLRKEASQDLIGALVHIKTAFKDNLEGIGQVFGSMKSLNGMLTLTGGQLEQVRQVFNNVRGTSGDLDRALKEVTDTTAFKLNKALNEFKILLLEIGGMIAPMFEKAIEPLKNFVHELRQLPDAQKQARLELLLWMAKIGPAILIIGNLSRALKNLYDVGVLIKGGMLLASAAIEGTSFAAVSATATTAGFAAAIAPLLPIIAAITAAIAAVAITWKVWNDEVARDAPIGMSIEAQKKLIAVEKESAEAAITNAQKAFDLGVEYKKLEEKTERTKEETARMRDILTQISELNPEVIGGYNKQGEAVLHLESMYSTLSDTLSETIRRKKMLLLADSALNQQKRGDQGEKMRQEIEGMKGAKFGVFRDSSGELRYDDNINVDLLRRHAANNNGEGGEGESSLIPEGWTKFTPNEVNRMIAGRNAELEKIKRQDKAERDALYAIDHPTQGPPSPSGRGSGKKTNYDIGKWDGSKDKNKKKKADEPEKDWGAKAYLDMLKDYYKESEELDKRIYLAGDTSKKKLVEWEFAYGKYSKTLTTLYGIELKLGEDMKKRLIEKGEKEDEVVKQYQNQKRGAELVEQKRKELVKLNKETEVQIAWNEILDGQYKELDGGQQLALLMLASLKDKQNEENEALDRKNKLLKAQKDARDKLNESIHNEILQMRESIKYAEADTETKKAQLKIGPGGEYEKLHPIAKRMLLDAARDKDANQTRIDANKDMETLRERIALLNVETELEKIIYQTTKGRYKDLAPEQKAELIRLTKEEDIKSKLIEQEKAYQGLIISALKQRDTIRRSLKGDTFEDKVNDIMDQNLNKDGTSKITREQATDIARRQQRLDNLQHDVGAAKKIAEGVVGLFENMINDLWTHGFKNFFKNIAQGFQAMLRQMAMDYLKSTLYKMIMKIVQIPGLRGANITDPSVLQGTDVPASLSGLEGRAVGGPVMSGKAYMVGERGPELFFPRMNGTILSNDNLMRSLNKAMATSRGMQFTSANMSSSNSSLSNDSNSSQSSSTIVDNSVHQVHVHGVTDIDQWRANQGAIATDWKRSLDRSSQRNGYNRR